MNPIGRIQEVPLREIWPHEARDFTKWIASSDGLSQLSDALEIEVEERRRNTCLAG